MASPPTSGWPSDADGLARIAADLDQTKDRRDRAFAGLMPTIRRVARRVAARYPGPYREDFAEEAAAEVWQALGGFQAGRPFEPWCYGVVRNHLVDRFREEQREQRHRARLASRGKAPGLQRALERALDHPAGLPQSDLATIRTWPLPQRLLVLTLSGLWEKVPAEEWEAWLEEYRAARYNDLPKPFPPVGLRDCDTIAERNAVLAAAMRAPRNTLSVWLFRYKQRLRDLQYVRGLLDGV
jgi:RNA polymerase sigma factor (sigma-70 family)